MEYVHLVGSEAVENAGRHMRQAAEQFSSSVAHLQEALFQHQRFMDEWLQRIEVALQHRPQGLDKQP